MCVQALPLILSAVGTAASAANQQQAQREQDRIAADNARRQEAFGRQADSRVNQEIQQVAGSNPDAERAKLQSDFMDALRQSKTQNGGGAYTDTPAGSGRFAEDLNAARAGTTAEGKTLSGNLARIDAPNLQRVREGVGVTNTATDLDLLSRRARGSDFLSQLEMARVHPNAAVDAFGSGLSAFGQAYAGRAIKPKPYNPRVAPGLTNAYDEAPPSAGYVNG